jgi:hypothetical protein
LHPDPQQFSADEATYELDRVAWNLPSPHAPEPAAERWAGERAQKEDGPDRARPAREVAEAT